MGDRVAGAGDDLTARFGALEAAYAPSRGQTFAGLVVAGMAAAGCFALAVLGCGLDVANRASAGLLGAGAIVAGYWLYRLRRWRLALFADGVVQVRAWGVDAVAWADVREVVEYRLRAPGEVPARVDLRTPAGTVQVSPLNVRSKTKLLRALVAAAARRDIPTRVEWMQTD